MRANPSGLRRDTRSSRKRRNDRRALFSILAFGGALLCGAALGRVYFVKARPTPIGGDYVLSNDQGKTITQADFYGKYTLLYFGYTHCMDVCPLTLSTVTAALQKIGPLSKTVVPVFVSIDPKRDTPDILRRYVQNFSPDIVGLTGTPEQIASVKKEFHVTATEQQNLEHPENYLVDHTSVLYLMGAHNQLVAIFPLDSSADVIAEKLKTYLPA